jgi:putative transposase
MPEYRRIKITGGTYFFTVVTCNRQPILTREELRQALREGIKKVRQSLPFIIEAWVLLPDHLHAIWTLPEGDANYQARWALIKSSVSRRCSQIGEEGHGGSESRKKRHESNVWQRRFWEHCIRDDLDFQRHIDYLHFNPVKHGYVRRVADWPFSSFHRLVTQNVYPRDWGGTACEGMKEEEFGE